MRYFRSLFFFLVLATAACMANAATSDSGSIAQLGFRFMHRCVLHSSGAVDCVSESPFLGGSRGGSGEVTFRPVQMIARGTTQLSVGDFSACAIVGGALDCWEKIPATGKQGVAPKQLIASGVTDVSVGDDHACAVAHGAALCWGSDSYGQSGHSDGNAQSTPWQVIAHGATKVAAGGDLSCAIADGALWCWGHTGLASDPHAKDYAGDYPPLRVFAHDVSAVAAGAHHVCAIIKGALWCWGDNSHGQVGLGYSRDHAQHSPNVLPWNAKEVREFADGDQTCLSSWKDIACQVEHPVKVIAYGVTDVFARDNETCALASGALMCWGYNWGGQLGIASDKQDVIKPTVAIPLGVTFVATDRNRTCAVMTGGTLSCTQPCKHDYNQCPQKPGFVTGDPNEMSGLEARVGVWRGRFGDSKVMVCLERPDTLNGSMYYYLRHRFSIPLQANDNSGATWNEASPSGQASDGSKPVALWNLQVPVGDVMAGTWSAADGSHKAPIQLTRVADAGTSLGAGCDAVDGSPSRLAFNAPRVASQELNVNQSSDGLRTISALNGNISFVELPTSTPHAARFNAAMRDWFADQIAGYYECASSSFNGTPDYNQAYAIDLLTPSWLVAQETYSAFCGGAHPSGGTAGYTVWNLDTGKTVNPWDFIKDSHWDFLKEVNHCDNVDNCRRRPPAGLAAIIVAHFKHDNANDSDCADAIDDNLNYLQLHPEKTGMVFSTTFPHVIQACDEDINLSWRQLKPFLTPQGEDAMQSLSQGR
ncbi:RCC1 domain-containing protein [Dyella choica]|nr:RCC1 domain-containing protein [Dyella choica]